MMDKPYDAFKSKWILTMAFGVPFAIMAVLFRYGVIQVHIPFL